MGNGGEILAEKLEYKFVMYKKNLITVDGLYGSIKNIIKNSAYLKASPLYLNNTNIIKPSLWKTPPVVK